MKKIIYSVVCASVVASSAMADFARVEAGAGAWLQTPKGGLTYRDGGANGAYVSDEKESADAYAWILIKHPVPMIPNLRVEYTNIKDEGVASGRFENFNLGVASTAFSYDMKQYDVIPYYNILDNTFWATLDLGLDIKFVRTSYTAAPNGVFGGYSGNMDFVLPLLYARTRAQIPTTDIGVEADIKYLSYGKSTMYDARAKLDYTFSVSPIIQPAIEVGYRVQKMDVDESQLDEKLDIKFAGFYAGAMLRF